MYGPISLLGVAFGYALYFCRPSGSTIQSSTWKTPKDLPVRRRRVLKQFFNKTVSISPYTTKNSRIRVLHSGRLVYFCTKAFEMIPYPQKELVCLEKAAILTHIIEDLPPTPWTTIEILDWTPDHNKLPVEYAIYESHFGQVLIANTPKGVCYLGVVNDESGYVPDDFHKRFGYANPREAKTSQQQIALHYLNGKMDKLLQFHLKGTSYQLHVWRRLLRIPFGKVISYATLAGNKHHARAAGTANGKNPVFYLVPCHRVVCTNGTVDRYLWGKEIKKRLLTWEFANSKESVIKG